MKSDKFYNLVEEILNRVETTLVKKGKEYSTEENKLHNFDRAAQMSDQSREKALLGMLLKHEVSIRDIVDKIDENRLPTIELLEEKLTDILSYYILLEASIKDKIDNQANIM